MITVELRQHGNVRPTRPRRRRSPARGQSDDKKCAGSPSTDTGKRDVSAASAATEHLLAIAGAARCAPRRFYCYWRRASAAPLPLPRKCAVSVRTALKLATWNLEWLIAPDTFRPLKDTCVPQGAPAFAATGLPCDVAQRLERSSRDFAALARYARELNADVIALQEVDGDEAARLVFPGYEFCFTGARTCRTPASPSAPACPTAAGQISPLSLGDSLRRGAELVLFPGEPREMHLLSVHLKSGCSGKPLDRRGTRPATPSPGRCRSWSAG